MSKLDELDKEIVAGLIHNFSLPEGLIEIQEEEYDDLAKVIKEIVNPAIKQARLEEREAMKKELDLKNQKPGDYSYANGNDMESFCRGYNACKEYVEWVIDGKPDLINELK